MRVLNSSGVTAPAAASTAMSATKTASLPRYGRANRRIRFRVSRVSLWSATVRSLAKLRMLGLPEVIDTGPPPWSWARRGAGLVSRW